MSIAPRDFRKHFAGGGKVIAGWCSIPSAVTAEIVARQGFDAIAIDLQHGLIDYQVSLQMLQATGAVEVPALCRVPWNDAAPIMKALDAGFTGIICPMVNTREDAEKFVGACRYAPRGYRSYGPTRAARIHADYATSAADLIVTFAMIETAEAVRNLDSILAVPDIDAVYIGPADLALSLGYAPSLFSTDAAVLDAIATICRKAKAAGKIAGIHAGSSAQVREMLA
ncbi:MAG: aldolase/citrate lyase family protein, partial [Usitatibacter sp.]